MRLKDWNLILFIYQVGRKVYFLIKRVLRKKVRMVWKKKDDWLMLVLLEQRKLLRYHFL